MFSRTTVPKPAKSSVEGANALYPEVSDLIVSYLEQIGVDYVFGVPGGAIEPLYNALARNLYRGGKIKPVFACHEASAAFMADGYARETGKLGVCAATSGPGASNMITGIACAYENHVPLLAITGQPALPNFGKGALQESSCTGVNIMSMMQQCTRYNSLVSHSSQLESKLVSAVMSAMQSTQGPVHLSIPVDVHRERIDSAVAKFDLPHLIGQRKIFYDQRAIAGLILELKACKRPIFLIGEGARGAIEAIMKLVLITDAIFLTSPDAKGLINARHTAYGGVFGFGGHPFAANLLEQSNQLTLAMGIDFDEFSSGGWSNNLLNTRLIHLDHIEDNFSRSVMAKLQVFGNIGTVCNYVSEVLLQDRQILGPLIAEVHPSETLALINPDQFVRYLSDAVPIKPQRLMRELSSMFPPGTRFLADAGNSMVWAPHFLQAKDRRKIPERRKPRDIFSNDRRSGFGNWLRIALNFAPMGWANGAAIGVAMAKTKQATVCITGDGAFLMSGNAITTAVLEKINIIYVILNDGVYGMVMHGQRLAKAEPIAYTLPEVDYQAMAAAMGIEAYIIRSISDLSSLDIEHLCNHPGPILLDVRIDKEEVPPMKMRLHTLGTME